MDFTGPYQFSGSQQLHSFMPMPPLTPSHSQSAPSEEFASPSGAFEQLPTGDYVNFDYNSAVFPGPPTPPNQFGLPQQQQDSQPQYSSPAPQQSSIHQPPSRNASVKSGNNSHSPDETNIGAGGSEDDENLPIAESRRKAQNRAAQRAFRERKEKHVKDLEAKVANLEAAQQKQSVENERLRRDLQKASTENEILRATSAVGANGQQATRSPEPTSTGPMKYQPTDFYSNVLKDHNNKFPSHRIILSDSGERLLAAGATWDYVIEHDLFKRGLVDIGGVSERLKGTARCDGQGPVFPESDIIRAIEQSVASGSDDLL